MKFLFALMFIFAYPLNIGLKKNPLDFPLGLKAGSSFTQFENQLNTKSFISVRKWKEKGTGKDSNVLYNRSEPQWKESDLYLDFSRKYNLKEYSYTGLCPKIGSTNPTSVTSFFFDNKLLAVSIILSRLTSYHEMKAILQYKYGNPTNEDSSKRDQGYLTSIWDNAATKIQLINNNPKGNDQINIMYYDLKLLDRAKIKKMEDDSIDY